MPAFRKKRWDDALHGLPPCGGAYSRYRRGPARLLPRKRHTMEAKNVSINSWLMTSWDSTATTCSQPLRMATSPSHRIPDDLPDMSEVPLYTLSVLHSSNTRLPFVCNHLGYCVKLSMKHFPLPSHTLWGSSLTGNPPPPRNPLGP